MSDLDSEGNLLLESGAKIARLTITPKMLIDHTIVIFGPSGTGKTVITKHIMKQLNGPIEQAIIIAPSEPSNQSYKGIVDPPLIHYRLYLPDPANPKKDDGKKGALRFLNAVWDRQEMMASYYTRANDLKTLAQLFTRLPEHVRKEGLERIKSMNARREAVTRLLTKKYSNVEDAGVCAEKIKEINQKFQKMLVLVYKKYIYSMHAELLGRADLTEDERCCIVYINMNPRLLLVFDDCAAQLKPFFNSEVFRKLFYQNRHSFITVVVCCQDDTDLPANLRKNARLTFFTTDVIARSNFERTANQFPKETKLLVNEMVKPVFQGHRKLVYIREDPARRHFYHILLPIPEPFRFGSSASHELCEAVQNSGMSMDKENPYYSSFKL
jgi:hypothetical protein